MKPPQKPIKQNKSNIVEPTVSKWKPKFITNSEEPKPQVVKVCVSNVLFNPAESFMKNIEKFKNNLPKTNNNGSSTNENQNGVEKPLLQEKKKNILWESANINSKSNTKLNLFAANRNRLQKSATQKSFKDKPNMDKESDQILNVASAVTEKNEAKSVFFDYKKLNEIESNIESAYTLHNPVNGRSKSALEFRPIGSIDLKFELPTVETTSNEDAPKTMLEQYYLKTANSTENINKYENGIDKLNSRINDSYNLLYEHFCPSEKIVLFNFEYIRK